MAQRVELTEGWTVAPASDLPPGAPGELLASPLPATVPGTVHTDLLAAGADPGPVPRPQRGRARPGSAAPTGGTRPRSTRPAAAARARRPGARRAGHRRHHRAQRGRRSARPRTCTGVPLRRRRPPARNGGNELVVTFASPVRLRAGRARPARRPPAGRVPRTRSTSSARWPATSAGTGARPVTAGIWRPVALEAWTRGPARRGSVRRCRSPTAPAGCACTSTSSGTTAAATSGPVRAAGRRRVARGSAAAGATAAVVEVEVRDAGALVAARLRRASRSTTSTWTSGSTRRCRRCRDVAGPLDVAPADRLPHRRARHRDGRHRHGVHPRRQRRAALRQGRQLDPRRLLPDPGRRASATRDRLRPGRRRQHQPAARLGRRDLRERRLLRRVRRAGAAGLAGLPVRLRRLPRGRAARAEVDAEARGQRRPADAAPEPGALERQQREHLGLARLGLAGRWSATEPGVSATTSTCCRASSPSSTRTRPYWPGSPYSGTADRPPNDDGHGTTHIWDVWNTADYTTYRDYVPRFVAEFGWQAPPTWATLRPRVHDDAARRRTRPGCSHHQKAADGNGKLQRGLAAALPRARATSTTGTSRPSSTRPARSRLGRRALPLAPRHAAWARSCGSSTTAGR